MAWEAAPNLIEKKYMPWTVLITKKIISFLPVLAKNTLISHTQLRWWMWFSSQWRKNFSWRRQKWFSCVWIGRWGTARGRRPREKNADGGRRFMFSAGSTARFCWSSFKKSIKLGRDCVTWVVARRCLIIAACCCCCCCCGCWRGWIIAGGWIIDGGIVCRRLRIGADGLFCRINRSNSAFRLIRTCAWSACRNWTSSMSPRARPSERVTVKKLIYKYNTYNNMISAVLSRFKEI